MVTLLKRARSPWADLDAPWPTCFDLAWEAYRAGTLPVGAIVTDADGRIVGRGRSRVHDLTAPAGRVCSSPLAHAEIDALLALTPERRHEDHTVWTTLEPCLLCMGAAMSFRIGRIVFALEAPFDGASSVTKVWRPALGFPPPGFRIFSNPDVVGGVCRDDALDLMRRYVARHVGEHPWLGAMLPGFSYPDAPQP